PEQRRVSLQIVPHAHQRLVDEVVVVRRDRRIAVNRAAQKILDLFQLGIPSLVHVALHLFRRPTVAERHRLRLSPPWKGRVFETPRTPRISPLADPSCKGPAQVATLSNSWATFRLHARPGEWTVGAAGWSISS